MGFPLAGSFPSDAIDGPDGDLERPVGQLSFSGSLDDLLGRQVIVKPGGDDCFTLGVGVDAG